MPEFTQRKLGEEVSANFNKIIEICQHRQFEADSGVGTEYRTLTRAAAQVYAEGRKVIFSFWCQSERISSHLIYI